LSFAASCRWVRPAAFRAATMSAIRARCLAFLNCFNVGARNGCVTANLMSCLPQFRRHRYHIASATNSDSLGLRARVLTRFECPILTPRFKRFTASMHHKVTGHHCDYSQCVGNCDRVLHYNGSGRSGDDGVADLLWSWRMIGFAKPR
jgi:hypothetical protein